MFVASERQVSLTHPVVGFVGLVAPHVLQVRFVTSPRLATARTLCLWHLLVFAAFFRLRLPVVTSRCRPFPPVWLVTVELHFVQPVVSSDFLVR